MPPAIAPAGLTDVGPLNDILSALIAQGDNTALAPLADDTFATWFIDGPTALFCLVARDETGAAVGFQSLSTYGDLGIGWADIGTFVKPGTGRKGTGTALMTASLARLAALGFRQVNATIRADNASGLAFYRKMGFQPYKVIPQVLLHDGRPVDRICHKLSV